MAQHQIGFLFLAAGAATRMRGSDKLLRDIDGIPLVQRTIAEALKLNFPVFVTVPTHDTERKLLILETNAVPIEVKDTDLGMGHSISTGVTQITQNFNFHSLAICPSDLPGLSASSLRKLINFFWKSPEMICRPTNLDNSKIGPSRYLSQKIF